ncbi:Nucleoporin nup57 [Friedmanniomyces endolithicus]|uniref:Nucleoporin nup57 n=1 Tax=Friedmanniomyces endolithicus TaxID=329885 RepID=A0AAN6QZK0_9PEZI|nr:Nucleoporin nup57 [Friedmanniomyces endolithicus]KAK0906817.1 Nucleoporin nup57 [Friedmanniomyces endolithicus]KAK0923448.1 Nucleoporin nup57 [Friedmanniomyces endolithicus]KAK1007208.1 Nucleoporin nup57 [Friedmanniomyces endolithicus]KAK1041277.1 Nucleoporin nup57 [Friedmanniomyces endolithicus]
MSSIFGNNPSGASLFGGGNTNTTNNNATTGQSLFGNMNQSSAPTGQSLFNNLNSQPANTSSSLFGAPNQQQQQPQQQQPSSLFSSLNQPQQQQMQQQQQPSLFASQQPQYQPSSSQFSTFPPNLTLPQQQDLARSRLSTLGLQPTSRHSPKPIPDQAATLLRKWDPQSQDTLLQTYLYNAVSAAYAPFYYRNPSEDEAGWEKALAAAPEPVQGEGGDGAVKFVPVLVRGFWDLGQRVEYQAHTVKAMQARLHEMNNSLEAVMSAHQQRITTHVEACRRRHVALAERTLRLSVKLQVLRNRGYALDGAEEALRKQLGVLAGRVADPAFGAREEELWARMVALRERARWLGEEGKRVGQTVGGQSEGGAGGVTDAVLETTRKILRDYDAQLRHLDKELAEVGREFAGWREGENVGAK